jgi:ATP-dependent phosphoenolpyruvate carboxykinase
MVALLLVFACGSEKEKVSSTELITQADRQNDLFQKLLVVTENEIPKEHRADSLVFLILPVQASCPACRKKTIDSIVKHNTGLAANHFIIVSASGGRKTISGYFKELNYELPEIPGKFFLDSNNLAFKTQLYKDKPTIYYTYNQKAYKKVAAIPRTVKKDLRDFFSGYNEH